MADAFTDRVEVVPKPRASFALTVIEGPSIGAKVVVEASQPSRVLVGSSEACALRIADPLVSRRHLALDLGEEGLRITDLDSTNGTFVDGVTLVDGYLRGGEIVRIGETALRVDRLDAVTMPALAGTATFGRVIGGSIEMRRLYPLCERLAQSNVPVVIEGETGTGKEALAEALHETGPRASGPSSSSIARACRAARGVGALRSRARRIHRRGRHAQRRLRARARRHAPHRRDRRSRSRAAAQAVPRGRARRDPSRRRRRPIKVDVRVLAATRRDLDREVAAGRFRDDLFHRLAVARIELPPLRRAAATSRSSRVTFGSRSVVTQRVLPRIAPSMGARVVARQRARAPQHDRAPHRAR